jgi:cytochrome c peroxidase
VGFAVVLLSGTIGLGSTQRATPLGLDEYFFAPDDNRLTAGKIELGRQLFFDRRLSADGRVSCASCHQPDRAFSDSSVRSRGVHGRPGTRNAPALVNRAYGKAFSWDGFSSTLERQVVRPFEREDELDLPLGELTARLRADPEYRRLFRQVFDEPPSAENAARVLASFVRAQRFGATAFDRYVAGDVKALTVEAQRGLEIFRGRANCATCHPSPTFSDEAFHNTGVSWGSPDLGRFGVTRQDVDRGAFKTPTLRELARTAPFMHDGSLRTLDEVVEFYDRGGGANPFRDPEIRALELSGDQRRELVVFLLSLSSER